ncbi:MAG: hypothetical protein FWE17_00540 [Alphaproteobacteria bacterium]|nr:hypothetical protein [Alphaproteobacteria bacterium]
MFNSARSAWLAAREKSELFDRLNRVSRRGINDYGMLGTRVSNTDRIMFELWTSDVGRVLREIDSKYGTWYSSRFASAQRFSRGDLKNDFVDSLRALTDIMRDFSSLDIYNRY